MRDVEQGELQAIPPSQELPEPSATALARDDDRLRRIVTESYDFVWRSIVRFGVPRAEAEDAAQEVFLTMSRKLEAIALGSERAFLFQAARRVASNSWRSIRRRREDEEPSIDHEDPSAGPEATLEASRARAMMDGLVLGLALDLREVFVLYELEELTMGEIAMILELPAGTVASRLRRARSEFREGAERLAKASLAKEGGA